jgi:Ca2+/Na+ antiporter
MNFQDLVKLDKELNIKSIGVYFIIVAAILYLIMYYRAEAEVTDEELGTNYKNEYPNTNNFPKYIVILFIVINTMFLYYSFTALRDEINRQNKTGKITSLDPYYLLILVNTLQLVATLISAYNVFVNDFGRVGITR